LLHNALRATCAAQATRELECPLSGQKRRFDPRPVTKCLEAIKSFSAANNLKNMGLINVVASEILKEVTPEIEAIKSNGMNADTADKYQAR
jgi:hypothetical protein